MSEVQRESGIPVHFAAKTAVDAARGTAAAEQDEAVQQRHRICPEDVLQEQVRHLSEAQVQQTNRHVQGQPLKQAESPELHRGKERLDAGKVDVPVFRVRGAKPQASVPARRADQKIVPVNFII